MVAEITHIVPVEIYADSSALTLEAEIRSEMKEHSEWKNPEFWTLNLLLEEVEEDEYVAEEDEYVPELQSGGYIHGDTILADLESYKSDWKLPEDLVDLVGAEATMILKCNAFYDELDELGELT